MIDLPQDTFNENETLKIDCQFAQSNINNDYKWYKDNQLLIPNNRIEIKKDLLNDSLIIHNLKLNDGGIYELKNANNILRTPLIKIIPSQKQELKPQISSKLVHEGKSNIFSRFFLSILIFFSFR
jgi:hypothetical protein